MEIIKLKKILVGIDFQKNTQAILAYASYFSRATGASLHLLHVIDYLVTPPAYTAPYIDEEVRAAEKKFSPLQKQLTNNALSVETEVVVGRIHESFASALKKTGADMLILGFAVHALRRSSSEKLIKGIKKPMLVVRGVMTEDEGVRDISIKRILCPSDFSDISKRAVKVAKTAGDLFGSELNVLSVYPDYLVKKLRTAKEREMCRKELFERTQSNLDFLLGEMQMKEAGIVREGEPAREIVSFATENGIDMIVMGARGLGLIRGMLIGSVTDTVLKTSPCPVLVVH
jgi:nucleotide-binding universal stress UspA family protein